MNWKVLAILAIGCGLLYYNSLIRLKYKFRTIQLVSVDATSLTVNMSFYVSNESNNEFVIDNIFGDLYINDTKVSTINQAVNQYVYRNTVSVVSAPIKINIESIATELFNVLSSGSLDNMKVEFKGEIKVDNLTYPLTFKYLSADMGLVYEY